MNTCAKRTPIKKWTNALLSKPQRDKRFSYPLLDTKELHPNDLVGVNKDSYLILDKLPAEYDSRVKAMEVDEKPQEDYNDVGGLDKQIEELVEAVVLPILHKE